MFNFLFHGLIESIFIISARRLVAHLILELADPLYVVLDARRQRRQEVVFYQMTVAWRGKSVEFHAFLRAQDSDRGFF